MSFNGNNNQGNGGGIGIVIFVIFIILCMAGACSQTDSYDDPYGSGYHYYMENYD